MRQTLIIAAMLMCFTVFADKPSKKTIAKKAYKHATVHLSKNVKSSVGLELLSFAKYHYSKSKTIKKLIQKAEKGEAIKAYEDAEKASDLAAYLIEVGDYYAEKKYLSKAYLYYQMAKNIDLANEDCDKKINGLGYDPDSYPLIGSLIDKARKDKGPPKVIEKEEPPKKISLDKSKIIQKNAEDEIAKDRPKRDVKYDYDRDEYNKRRAERIRQKNKERGKSKLRISRGK